MSIRISENGFIIIGSLVGDLKLNSLNPLKHSSISLSAHEFSCESAESAYAGESHSILTMEGEEFIRSSQQLSRQIRNFNI